MEPATRPQCGVAKKKAYSVWARPIKRMDWYGQRTTDVGQTNQSQEALEATNEQLECKRGVLWQKQVWRTKFIFQIKIITSNLVNVFAIFSIHFATDLINKSVSFHEKKNIYIYNFPTNLLFPSLKCENGLVVFALYDNKLNLFGL